MRKEPQGAQWCPSRNCVTVTFLPTIRCVGVIPVFYGWGKGGWGKGEEEREEREKEKEKKKEKKKEGTNTFTSQSDGRIYICAAGRICIAMNVYASLAMVLESDRCVWWMNGCGGWVI